MTKAQRINRAMIRAEEAAADLLFNAERWTLTNRTMYDIRNDRRDLLRTARAYGKALESISKVRVE